MTNDMREKLTKVLQIRDSEFMIVQGRPATPIENADAIIAALPDMVQPLNFGEPDRNGSYYTDFPLGAGFDAYYEINQVEFDLATVSFGISCHEFGEKVIWKGPKAGAIAAANAHHVAQALKPFLGESQ